MRSEPAVVVRHAVGPPPFALRLAAVLAVPLLLYALVVTGQKAVDNYRLNREANGLRAQVLGLREENLALQREIEQSRGDTAIEAIAREQLNLVRPGDRPVVVIPSSASQDAAGSSPSATDAPARPVWRQWWDLLFH
jgi:cell division protein FtsB